MLPSSFLPSLSYYWFPSMACFQHDFQPTTPEQFFSGRGRMAQQRESVSSSDTGEDTIYVAPVSGQEHRWRAKIRAAAPFAAPRLITLSFRRERQRSHAIAVAPSVVVELLQTEKASFFFFFFFF